MGNILSLLWKTLLDTFFPKERSIAEIEELFTSGKVEMLPLAPECPRAWMHALFHYKHSGVRLLVWQIKFKGNPILVRSIGSCLSEEIVAYFEEHSSFASKDWLLIPIPATALHKKEKGFNQTELLCRATMKYDTKNFVSYNPHVLQKIKQTKPQVELRNKSQRLKNLEGAYCVTLGAKIEGKNIILIDDVITTGSTLIEARRALRGAGAKEVVGFAIAH